MTTSAKSLHFQKNIAQDYSYTQELSMGSVPTGQYDLVCFSGGYFLTSGNVYISTTNM